MLPIPRRHRRGVIFHDVFSCGGSRGGWRREDVIASRILRRDPLARLGVRGERFVHGAFEGVNLTLRLVPRRVHAGDATTSHAVKLPPPSRHVFVVWTDAASHASDAREVTETRGDGTHFFSSNATNGNGTI